MTTKELIERLYQHHEDCVYGRTQDCLQICFDCREAADRLEIAMRLIDDMTSDHYVDYLEFYANRCRELEEELSEKMSNFSNETY